MLQDVRISGNLLPEGSEDPTENCCEFEKILAERYRDQKSEENKEMRRELQKVILVCLYDDHLCIVSCSCKPHETDLNY